MRGAVAAGHEITAQAGRRALEEGGNAVDACIAAAFASWVAESPLTGPGAGRFHARPPRPRPLPPAARLLRRRPGSGAGRAADGEMDAVDIPSRARDDAALPHRPCILRRAGHGRRARRPIGRTGRCRGRAGRSAIELARDGVVMTKAQALLHALLDSILRHTPESRAVYGGGRGSWRATGSSPDLADTLEVLAADGPDALYRGELGAAIAAHVQEHGGAITRRDLETYRVIRRRPVEVAYRGHVFESNPPPSSGGVLIGYGLALLDRAGAPGGRARPPSSRLARGAARADARAGRALHARALPGGWRGACCRRTPSPRGCAACARPQPAEVASPGGTTHISAMDAEGNAASLSSSTGAGSGVVVPGTGIHMNNMLGEYDLQPGGPRSGAGHQADEHDGALRGVETESRGSSWAARAPVRLRGAVMQVVVNVVDHGLGVRRRSTGPACTWTERTCTPRVGTTPRPSTSSSAGYDVVRWRRRNLFFGGVAAVERCRTARWRRPAILAAAGTA